MSEFLRAMRPAVHDILTADELAVTTIHALDGASQAANPWPTWPEAAGDRLIHDETIVSVSTLGNTIGIWAGGGRETATEAYERVRSDLQDFVAGSTFGRGQLRPRPPRPPTLGLSAAHEARDRNPHLPSQKRCSQRSDRIDSGHEL